MWFEPPTLDPVATRGCQTSRVDIPGHPDRTQDELAVAYVAWLRSDDPSYEWAWEAMHDGICFSFDPLDALELLVRIAGELDGDARALKLLGAGPWKIFSAAIRRRWSAPSRRHSGVVASASRSRVLTASGMASPGMSGYTRPSPTN